MGQEAAARSSSGTGVVGTLLLVYVDLGGRMILSAELELGLVRNLSSQ